MKLAFPIVFERSYPEKTAKLTVSASMLDTTMR